MPIPALVAAAPAIATALSSAINFISGGHANRANIRNQNELLRKQFNMQQELNANGALVQKQGLERAGMNVLSQFGPNLNLSAPSPSKSDIIAPQADLSGLAQMAQMMQQQPLVDAQAKVASEQAEAQRIENERNKSKDLVIRNQTLIDNVVKNGNLTDQEFLDWYSDNIRPVQENLGSFEARKLLRAYQSELFQFDAQDAQNLLKKKVAENQIKSSPVIEALTNMPTQEFERLFAETNDLWASVVLKGKQGEYYDAQTALTDTENELKQNSSLIPLIQKYIPEGGLRDAITALVIIASSFTGVNLGFKGKTIVNREGNTTTNTHTHTHTHNTTNTHTGNKVWVKNGK